MDSSKTLLTAVTSSRVRHFSGHESDLNDGASVAVDTAKVNLPVVLDALMNSCRSIRSPSYPCIVARTSMQFLLHLPCTSMWLFFRSSVWLSFECIKVANNSIVPQ